MSVNRPLCRCGKIPVIPTTWIGINRVRQFFGCEKYGGLALETFFDGLVMSFKSM
ncbi:hypothetical protein LINGRAHAP2_LOCUS15347 [Linum grandiflorum]